MTERERALRRLVDVLLEHVDNDAAFLERAAWMSDDEAVALNLGYLADKKREVLARSRAYLARNLA